MPSEISQMHTQKASMYNSTYMGIVKNIKTESRMVIARSWEEWRVIV